MMRGRWEGWMDGGRIMGKERIGRDGGGGEYVCVCGYTFFL